MFDFFKKNKPKQPEAVKEKASIASATPSSQGGQEPAQKEQIKSDNIVIHVMPKRFRNQPVKQDSAKTTGLIIIIGGAAVLLIASAALYYFLFREPNIIVNKEPLLTAENNQPGEAGQTEAEVGQITGIPDVLTATGTDVITLPPSDEIATTTVATTTPEIAPPEIELNLRVGADSDNDGLTDIEEILLGTSSSTPDTDGDGYLDGSELIDLYDPASEGKLTANSNIFLYENKTFAYDLLYPLTWQISANGGDDSLMFKTGDNQFIQVIVQPNVNNVALDEWYMEQLGVLAINQADRISGSNWQGIKNPDGLNIYLMDKKQNYIFNLTYNPGGGNILEYFNIFQMMVKSFNLKD